MRKSIPWSTRRFFASNSAKMQDINAKRRRLKEMRNQQAPLNTMEALSNAFSTPKPDNDSSEGRDEESDQRSITNS